MNNENLPDFKGLARTDIEINHPEVLNFPDDIIEKAVEYKALKLQESYKTMLRERNQ